MLDIRNYLSNLENTKKPASLIESYILQSKQADLRIKEFLDESFLVSKVVVKNTKGAKKSFVKNLWDADIKSTGQGYFDVSGNFIIDKPKKISILWLAKRNDSVEGPFTEKEFKQFLDHVLPSGYWVKRDSDKGFVQLDKLLEEIPNFISSKDLNKYFAANQQKEEIKKENSFFDTSIFAEKSSRLTNFLRNHEISASVDFIVKTIKGVKKNEAVELLMSITGLDKTVNTSLVDLIVESVGHQILSDVDKDGFYLGKEPTFRKRK